MGKKNKQKIIILGLALAAVGFICGCSQRTGRTADDNIIPGDPGKTQAEDKGVKPAETTACTGLKIEACQAAGCVVCPPCAACSSFSCQTEKFCQDIGFDRSWYDSLSKGCVCPSGYRQAGEICTPECYFSTPKCLAPSFTCGQGRPGQVPTVPAAKCGLENCHGLEMKCGTQPAEMCTMIYQLGDKCRQYANCEVVAGSCQLIPDPKFQACKGCVEDCLVKHKDDQAGLFSCEAGCK